MVAIIERDDCMKARSKSKRRSHAVCAFGSSTPRMLEPADTVAAAAAAAANNNCKGTRRATSKTDVMSAFVYTAAAVTDRTSTLTRRSTEPELGSGKNRAASNACLAYRRRTDLVPTLPSSRAAREALRLLAPTSLSGRSSNAKSFARSRGMRSGEETRRSLSKSMSALSQKMITNSSARNSLKARPRTTGSSISCRARPASIACTGITSIRYSPSDLKAQKDSKLPLPLKSYATSKKPMYPMMPLNSLIQALPQATPLQSTGTEHSPITTHFETAKCKTIRVDKNEQQKTTEAKTSLTQKAIIESVQSVATSVSVDLVEPLTVDETAKIEPISKITQGPQNLMDKLIAEPEAKSVAYKTSKLEGKSDIDFEEQRDLSAFMIQEISVSTEKQAKAVLLKSLARELTEKKAEMEKQRLEEARIETEKQRIEEEELRIFKEDTLRLAEEAENERFNQAIEEAKRMEVEDHECREEEAKLKAEQEEAEKKAKEEADKQQLEMDEHLKKEEEERIARIVEAVMSRARCDSKDRYNLSCTNDQMNELDCSICKCHKMDNFSKSKSPRNWSIILMNLIVALGLLWIFLGSPSFNDWKQLGLPPV